MINKIFRSKSDLENLSLERTSCSSAITKFDYKGIVVNKPWGYEYMLFNNECVSIWLLYLVNDCQTSMHCHPRKKTSLINILGKLETTTLTDTLRVSEKDAVILENGVFHSTKSLFDPGSYLIEIETPPNKLDLVRLKDAYGRQGTGYEGKTEMTKETNLYEYHYFEGHSETKNIFKKKISVMTIQEFSELLIGDNALMCIIDYSDRDSKIVGEVFLSKHRDKYLNDINDLNTKVLIIE